MQLDFSIILDWLPAFGSALLVTLKTTVFSLILGLVISVPLSLCKISTFKPLQWFAFFYTSVFRGVPLLVQVFMMYFGIPLVLPVRFTAFQAGTLVFAMNSPASGPSRSSWSSRADVWTSIFWRPSGTAASTSIPSW